ncbi:bzip transcription factor [Phytophthora cinnamomi]|uniref:bzip transcription factor n=1 Tax=Phytophthora cinnamomi TaxID=4785 RepID=UPI00355A78DD|nr:bzip transcription factor [Phytophthora cinnamomi]
MAAAEKTRLRELRRVRQIRYCKKKEDYMHTLEDETRQLRDEIEQLEQRRRSASAAIPAKESAWSMAAEYFRLFRYGLSESALLVDGLDKVCLLCPTADIYAVASSSARS